MEAGISKRQKSKILQETANNVQADQPVISIIFENSELFGNFRLK